MPPPGKYDTSGATSFACDSAGTVYGVKTGLGELQVHPREVCIRMFGFLQHQDISMFMMLGKCSGEITKCCDVMRD
jgi:hypothetical protein